MELGNIVMALTVLHVFVNCQEFKYGDETVEEVVSIYGENFETPGSRDAYFIKVHRCVTFCLERWPVPSSQKEIEIVVPDINNKRKFYKYIVYNHTACTCGSSVPKMHNTKHNEVNETEFKAKVPNNPMNLRNCSAVSFCNKPQPRYMANPQASEGVNPEEKFILFYQCYPGCMADTTNTTMVTNLLRGNTRKIYVPTDNACAPYGINVTRQSQKGKLTAIAKLSNNSRQSLKTEDANEPETDNGLLIYIASPKVFLAALVLSIILVSILIVDFNLCHRQKGMLYSVLNCTKDSKDNACPACADRQQRVVEMV